MLMMMMMMTTTTVSSPNPGPAILDLHRDHAPCPLQATEVGICIYNTYIDVSDSRKLSPLRPPSVCNNFVMTQGKKTSTLFATDSARSYRHPP
jgi:hypothetical protein